LLKRSARTPINVRAGRLSRAMRNIKLPSVIAAAAFCCGTAQNITMVEAGELAGVSMPHVLSVAGRQLRLNGMGVGTKAFFKVYVIGLYLERPTPDARTAIRNDDAKRIVLVMLRDVSREKFVQAVEKGMMRNSGLAMPTFRARLDLLEHALPALQKGNALDFTYLPGIGTVVRGQGREMKIPGKDFADALFSVWLGSEPSNAALQHQLLGG
jgi:chalcone isomerase-like protein